MKILQLGKFYPIRGGVEKVMYDLMSGLSERGIDCDMMCAGTEGYRGTVKVNDHGKVFVCRSWMKLAGTMICPTMITALRSRCRDYDIIHVHHPDPMATLALWFTGFKGKVVLHWHSDIVQQKTMLKIYMPLQKWLLKRADIIVGTTPVYLRNSPHLKEVQDKTTCLPIGIEPIREVDEKCITMIRDRYRGKKIIFSLGRLVPYKGYEHLIDAGQYLSDEYVILIGGQGPLYERLEEKIQDLGLQNGVKLLGRISDEELPAYYKACDLYCMSSIYKTEAFGIVQIEAMSCGKPLIATNIPESGVSWVNEHGVSGINVSPMDGKELAEAMLQILDNPDVYQKFAEGSRRRFNEVFRLEQMVEGAMGIYEKLKD